jgi:hypothetical protein
MDTNKIFKGTIVWSLGLLIPSIYHALLMLAAVQEEDYSYSFHNMARYFSKLPWIIWPYLIAMAIVGLILVIYGFKDTKE